MRKIKRNCSICDKNITIELAKDGQYSGGHYFGKIKLKAEKFEYWECNKCYKK